MQSSWSTSPRLRPSFATPATGKPRRKARLVEPGAGMRMLPTVLPGLKRFMVVGQWVLPGGGLPSGPMTARPVVKAICKQDHVPFQVHSKPEPVAALA